MDEEANKEVDKEVDEEANKEVDKEVDEEANKEVDEELDEEAMRCTGQRLMFTSILSPQPTSALNLEG